MATSRLFCFSHAGGGPVAFFEWAQRFGQEIECVCIQYPGRGQRFREEPLTTIQDLVGEISHGLADFFDKPFAFYGHSFGGIVAFELTRQMRRYGMPGPSHLFVGATRPPHLEAQQLPVLHLLPEKEFVENVQSRYGGIPVEIFQYPDVLKMFLPALRADLTAYETYKFRGEEPLGIPITIFAGEDDSAVKVGCMHEWALHTDAGFDMKVLPGGHFFLTTSATEIVCTLQANITSHLKEQDPQVEGAGLCG